MAKHLGKRERLARKVPKKRRGRCARGNEPFRKLGHKKTLEFIKMK